MAGSRYRLFQVIGRKAPTDKDANPPAYRMKVPTPALPRWTSMQPSNIVQHHHIHNTTATCTDFCA